MADTGPIVPQRTLTAAGLDASVEIIVDKWGIPHIYAASTHDAFFAQGWNAARDRLWQLDLWRKRGLGLLSENFGPDYVAQDRATRLFLYRGDMDAEWAAYGADAKSWSRAFVAGVNAYVGQVRAGAAPTPVEFALTSSQPALWQVDDLVRIRSHGISNNAESEALRARVAAAGGLNADRIRRKLDPPHELRIPEGLNPADVPDDIFATYVLATKEVSFTPPGAPETALKTPPLADLAEAAASQGSNNWAIAPSRTATGRPILASDPHRVLGAPSIRYLAHLDAPGLHVMGAGELHLPGITIGHNDRVAFGITTFMADQADIYVYELNPDNPRQYRYGEGWEDFRFIAETVTVKGEAACEVELAFTRHGPVLKLDPEAGRAFALRSVWFEPGTSSYFAAARYQSAGDWPTFKQALSHWGAAAMNFVYADVDGNIAWIPTGLMPRRPNWDGLMPVPGDGRYEWQGFRTQDELPFVHNPARGWVGSANEMNLPKDYPARSELGFEWADPCRMDRIDEVLGANGKITVDDCLALQTDVFCGNALRATALLRGLKSDDPMVDQALRLLEGWDGHEPLHSAAAAIAEVWLNKHLGPHAAARITTPAAAKLIAFGQPYALSTYLQDPETPLGGQREELLLASLKSALDEIGERLGSDMSAWRWGDLHHARFVPPAAALADDALRELMIHGPTPLPGSAFTVRAATYRMDDFAAINGASFRMVVDVGDWDNSRIINSPGQSGDPASPHYNDLFPLWADGQYVPMLWTRPAIEAAASQVIVLTPAG
ncbi:MAG TPA: penicillin acylase family protein [Caulobacteraceae bacterium]|jgi:penicillin amidase|nr:penicillin acylase family protein [Caulobacteraceae bacterium]